MSRRVRIDRGVSVDIVMPFFNHGMFVEEAVASARAQSRPVDEIVIVDDGSTDSHSIAVLRRLKGTGVTVLHQKRSGPGAARNRGIRHCSGDAVLFLDSDDRVGEGFVEEAVTTLAASADDVGFVYPDQQFFGNREDLAVMPSYNLFILANRNFIGTGSLLDRAVFDQGHFFRPQLVHGHEDWDYFLALGENGIHGEGFHGEPLYVRKWGYSRADSVDDAYGLFHDEIRELHPNLFATERFVDVKRCWSPAVSVLSTTNDGIAEQTCADFEVVPLNADEELPEVRGRWVLIGTPGSGLLSDSSSIERAVRLLEDRPVPSALGFSGGDQTDVVAWQRLPGDAPPAPIGVVMDGATYARWRITAPAGASLSEALSSEMVQRNIEWRWVPTVARTTAAIDVLDVVPIRADPPPPDQTPAERDEIIANYGSNKGDGGRLEESFRWSTPPLYFPMAGLRRIPIPRGTESDGMQALVQRAWGSWVPTQSQRLDLIAWPDGSSLLEPVDDRGALATTVTTPPGATRTALGRVWVRPFPGTACLYSSVDIRTHAITYRVSDGEARGRTEVPLGYVSVVPLSDMTSLREAITTAQSAGGISGMARLRIDVEVAGDFIEQISGVAEHGWAPGGAIALKGSPGGAPRRWPLFELGLDGGRYRYGTHPDECVWRPDTVRSSVKAVAAVIGYEGSLGGSTLHEVRYRGTGGTGYVSGPAELAAGKDVLDPVRVLGVVNEVPRRTVALIRLRPSGTRTPPAGEPGHRLTVDWMTLVEEDYEPEGAVGFAAPPDDSLVPLYRWRNDRSFDWRLTLGERPDDERHVWTLDGTVGSAWRPGTRMPGLKDLWEMECGDLVTYATRPEEFEPAGFLAKRVVARVRQHRTPGCVPLYRSARGGDRPWLFTPCRAELRTSGFVEQGIVGFLDPGAPPCQESEVADSDLPDWAAIVDAGDTHGGTLAGVLSAGPVPGGIPIHRRAERGMLATGDPGPGDQLLGYCGRHPIPFGIPVYLVANRVSGEQRISCVPSEDAMDDVEDIVGFMWSRPALQAWPEYNATPDGPPLANPMARVSAVHEEPPSAPPGPPLAARAAALARRTGVTKYVPAPVRQAVRRVMR